MPALRNTTSASNRRESTNKIREPDFGRNAGNPSRFEKSVDPSSYQSRNHCEVESDNSHPSTPSSSYSSSNPSPYLGASPSSHSSGSPYPTTPSSYGAPSPYPTSSSSYASPTLYASPSSYSTTTESPCPFTPFGDPAHSGSAFLPASIRRKRPQGDPDRARRPQNAFLIFRSQYVKSGLGAGKDQSEISKIAGKQWNKMSKEEQREYDERAKVAKEQHAQDFPDYVYVSKAKVKGKAGGADGTADETKSIKKKQGVKGRKVGRSKSSAASSKGFTVLCLKLDAPPPMESHPPPSNAPSQIDMFDAPPIDAASYVTGGESSPAILGWQDFGPISQIYQHELLPNDVGLYSPYNQQILGQYERAPIYLLDPASTIAHNPISNAPAFDLFTNGACYPASNLPTFDPSTNISFHSAPQFRFPGLSTSNPHPERFRGMLPPTTASDATEPPAAPKRLEYDDFGDLDQPHPVPGYFKYDHSNEGPSRYSSLEAGHGGSQFVVNDKYRQPTTKRRSKKPPVSSTLEYSAFVEGISGFDSGPCGAYGDTQPLPDSDFIRL